MAGVDAAKPPSLSEHYFLKGKDKPSEEAAAEAPVTTPVEETVAEAAVSAVEESPAVESNESTTAADEGSKTSDAASVESSEAAPAEAASGDDSTASEEATESENVDDQEAAEDAPKIKLETAPADFRFPTTNQTRHCFTRYVEFHRCTAAKGEDDPDCQKFAKYYRALCPGEWVDRWNEQRENGTFPGPS